MKTETIHISGMGCQGCVVSIQNVLKGLGITKAEVEIGKAVVEYDEGTMSREKIAEAIDDAGYEVVKRHA